MPEKLAIAMSGGVDSSAAACLLQEQGYDLIGMTMKLFDRPDQVWTDGEDAKAVARQLGFPHHMVDLSPCFRAQVMDSFAAAYEAGRTPNPCVTCNRHIKFGALLQKALELGCDKIATGHYARVEYDSGSEEVIKPNHGAEQLKLPEKCVYAFLGEAVDDYAFEAEAIVAETFETITRNYPVYIVKQDGMEFCLCAAPLGAPAAAQLMDFLISCGCKKIISTGSCGVLTDLAENEFLIPVKALRDEGTSYHYLPASRYIELNKNIRDAIEHTLLVQNIPFQECVTWTTDGFFRETQDMVRYRGAEGCTTVEMECAALAACAQKRGASFGQILYTADSLANIYAHDERDWGKGSLRKALELCIAVLQTI